MVQKKSGGKTPASVSGPKLELRKVDSLTPYEKNSRTHAPGQVRQLVRSLQKWGWTKPVLVDEKYMILAGHGIVLAAAQCLQERLAIKDWPDASLVPVVVKAGLTRAEKRAYVIADNKLAENAGWDLGVLSSELADLKLEGFDLSLTGFDQIELSGLLSGHDERDPDAAPALQEKTVSSPGDLWVLGPHRVLVGDATNVQHLAKLLDGALADCVWTDPPYNVAYEGAAGEIQNDSMADADFQQFLNDTAVGLGMNMKPGAALYVAHADLNGKNGQFTSAFLGAGFHLQNVIIWRKSSLVLGRCDYQSMHEPILYGWKPGSKHKFFGGRKQTTIADTTGGSPFQQQPDGRWAVQLGDEVLIVDGKATVTSVVPSVIRHDKPKSNADHPTMKPVGLIEQMLKNSARPGDIVLDVFGGSGSTLIAADRLGMCARLLELDPKFADVIVRRWQEFTGRKATLGTLEGKTFDAIAGELGIKPKEKTKPKGGTSRGKKLPA